MAQRENTIHTLLANQPTTIHKLLALLLRLILIIFAILWISPLIWAILTALKPEDETTIFPLKLFPSHISLDAFKQAFSTGSLFEWYLNSFITSLCITLLGVFFASMAAFSFSCIRFRGSQVLFWLLLAGLTIPPQVLFVPLFMLMHIFDMANSYWGIILPQIASPVAIFIFKYYFDGLPRELRDAAQLDGANRWRIYWQVWLPLARPAVAAVSIYLFVSSWNNFVWPFIITTTTDMMTVPVGIATVPASYGLQLYAQIMAWALLGSIPALAIFLILQGQINRKITDEGMREAELLE